MQIDLTQLEGEPLDFRLEVEVPAARLASDEVQTGVSVHLEGRVRRTDGGFGLRGSMKAWGSVSCSRCLASVPWSAAEPFELVLRRPEELGAGVEVGLDEEDLDIAMLNGDTLDLEELAAEQVLLALPMKILCAEDCAGLCPRCGARRGAGPGGCGCDAEPDPRWGPLQNLKKNLQ